MDTILAIFDFIIHLVTLCLYDPVYWIYGFLPFSDALSAWREAFVAGYFKDYLLPIILDLTMGIAIEAFFGAALGSAINLGMNVVGAIHFLGHVWAGLWFIAKGVFLFPVFLLAAAAPFILPPICMFIFICILAGIFTGAAKNERPVSVREKTTAEVRIK